MSVPRVVVVGAGHAGVQVAGALKELVPDCGVTLIEDEPGLPYERPPLSKEVLEQGPASMVPLRHAAFYAARGIELIAGARAAALEPAHRRVRLADGRSFAYDKAVIATGARARPLPVPGAQLAGVRQLRTSAEACGLHQALRARPRVVVVGAGYIGLEAAAAAVQAGCQVTVLEAQARVMSRVTSELVSRFFERLHRTHGVVLQFGVQVAALLGQDRVEAVVASDGQQYPCDLVLVGIGVTPNQELAQACGIACDDGVLTDARGRTSDPDVYAIGDVSRSSSPQHPRGLRLECVQSAVWQAQSAAAHMLLGREIAPEVPWFWTLQHGVRLQSAGLPHPQDEPVVRGDVDAGRFSVLYLREGRLAAIDTVDALRDFAPARRLIAAAVPIDRGRAADPSVKLAACTLSLQADIHP